MYTAVLFLGVQNAASVQPVVSIERTVFYRERAAGMYSALPYAFAQVICLTNDILQIIFRILCVFLLNFFIFCAGTYWDSLYICSICHIWCYSLCNDWIWMDCRKVPLVSILHVLHFIVLHLLWHDGCSHDTKPPHFWHRSVCILWLMECLFWVHNPKNSKYQLAITNV